MSVLPMTRVCSAAVARGALRTLTLAWYSAKSPSWSITLPRTARVPATDVAQLVLAIVDGVVYEPPPQSKA